MLFPTLGFGLSLFLRAKCDRWQTGVAGGYSEGEMALQLLKSCVMILRSKTGRLVTAVAPELSPAASSVRDVDQRQQAVLMIQNSCIGRKMTAQNLWAESGLVVAPF